MPMEFVKEHVPSSELPKSWQKEFDADPNDTFIIIAKKEVPERPVHIDRGTDDYDVEDVGEAILTALKEVKDHRNGKLTFPPQL